MTKGDALTKIKMLLIKGLLPLLCLNWRMSCRTLKGIATNGAMNRHKNQ
jgi:hypothetical protein